MAATGALGERRRQTAVAGCVVGAALAALAAVPPAAAGSLGGLLSATFAGYTFAFSPGAPTVVAADSFTGSDGTNLDGLAVESGGLTWAATGGTWTLQSGRARSTSAVSSALLVDGGSSGGAVEAAVSPGGAAWDTYLILDADASFTTALVADWWSGSDGTIALYSEIDGTFTEVASVTDLYPGGAPASAVVRLEASATTVHVYLDGALVITYTLSGAEQTRFGAAGQTWAGIGTDLDPSSTFDDFHLDG